MKKDCPWIEKYRPQKLDEISDQKHIVNMLKTSIKEKNLPHLLFYGPPGTGKTSIILAGAREMFGDKLFNSRVIILNASDDRGINAVREKIKTFAKASIRYDTKFEDTPPYKLIILDESDSMTTDAQAALRKIIEDNTGITRFCFICNYINKISEPIISRCSIFRFNAISNEFIEKKIKEISEKENINIKDENIKLICDISRGDLRRAIMILQNMKYYILYNETDKNINDNILEIAGYQSNAIYQKIFQECITKDTEKIISLATKIYKNGFSSDNVLEKLCHIIIDSDEITDQKKGLITSKFCGIQKKMIDGGDEYLLLLHLLLEINKTLK